MAKKPKPKTKPKATKRQKAPKASDKPPTDPNEFAKWLVDRTTGGT